MSAPPHSTLPCRSWSWPLSLLLPSPNTLSSTPSLGWGLLPPRTVASTHRPSAASTRIVMASSASQTFGRPTPSWVSTHLPPSPTRSPRGPAERGQASSLPPLPTPLSPCWLSQVPRFTLPPPPPHTTASASPPLVGKERRQPRPCWGHPGSPCPPHTHTPPGKVSVPEEELDAMLQEGKGPINFTVFLTLFGEKLNGEPGAGLDPLVGQPA